MSAPEPNPFAPPAPTPPVAPAPTPPTASAPGGWPAPLPLDPAPVPAAAPRRGKGLRGAVIAVAVVLFVIVAGLVGWGAWVAGQALGGTGWLDEQSDGDLWEGEGEDTPAADSVYPADLSVGDCFDTREVDWEDVYLQFDLMGCYLEHTDEVYAVVQLSAADAYPGDAVLETVAEEYCTEELDRLVPEAERDDWYHWYYAPFGEEWWSDDQLRKIHCVAATVYDHTERHVFRWDVLDVATPYVAVEPGTCFDADEETPATASGVLLAVRPCDTAHLSEAFATVPLPAEQYPGDIQRQLQGDAACQAEAERLGLLTGALPLTVGSVSPWREQWGKSTFKEVLCYVGSSETLLRGSVQDGTATPVGPGGTAV